MEDEIEPFGVLTSAGIDRVPPLATKNPAFETSKLITCPLVTGAVPFGCVFAEKAQGLEALATIIICVPSCFTAELAGTDITLVEEFDGLLIVIAELLKLIATIPNVGVLTDPLVLIFENPTLTNVNKPEMAEGQPDSEL